MAIFFTHIKYFTYIKLSATTKQLIRRNSICCLKNLAIFFLRINIEIGLISPLPLFVFTLSLSIPLPPAQPILYLKEFVGRDGKS